MKYLYGILFFLVLTGCARKVNISGFIYKDQPIILKTYNEDFSGVISTVIEPGSYEYDELLVWMENNKKSWRPTKASYVGSALAGLYQKDFKILVFETAVAVSVVEDKSKLKQYKKKTLLEEFDFILER